MRVLVAGGSGFIGSAVVDALHTAGHEVVVASRSRGRLDADVQHVPCDVGHAPPDPDAVGHVDAIVNLVGIAIERGANTFAVAHVEAVRHLLSFAEQRSIDRFVHVSVVRIDSAHDDYHRTKREGEALVTASDRAWTLLRPGLVYGEGDAMMSSLVRFIRLAPVFPIPSAALGPLQVVDVRDVALAVVHALPSIATHGRALDVVGPTPRSLATLIGDVSAALSLRTWTLPLPSGLMRVAARGMTAVLPAPPVTPTQLNMLIHGLYGDVTHAREQLDLQPRPLKPATIETLAKGVRGPSLRLLPDADAQLEARRWAVPAWFPLLAIASLLGGPWIIENLWLRMLAINLGLVTVLAALGAPLRTWIKPRVRWLLWGLGAAAVMLGGAVGVLEGLRVLDPNFVDSAREVYGWSQDLSVGAMIPALIVIASTEDLVWRFGVTLGATERLGPALAVLTGGISFAIAHATTGPPILVLAALLAGLAWSALAMRTRAWVAVATCHVVWDLAMFSLAL